ncbi:MAG: hypothetical protein RID59_13395 [Hoeflea sp.]
MTRNTLALLAFGLIAAALTGCAWELRENSRLEPTSPDSFRFATVASAEWPIDSPEGEASRRQALERFLELNDMCSGGYVIDDRRAVLRNRGLLADRYDLYYEGRCS